MRGWYTTNQELQQKAAGIWDIVKERPNLHSKYTRMAEMDEIRYQYVSIDFICKICLLILWIFVLLWSEPIFQ